MTNSTGTFTNSFTLNVGSQPVAVVAADVNEDGLMDLISANYGANTLTVLTNNGSGGFGSNATYAVGSQPQSIAAADINGDGHVDLIGANFFANTLTVLTNNGSGGFALASTLDVGKGPSSVTVADVNGNGGVDLISANQSANTLTVLTNTLTVLANYGHVTLSWTIPSTNFALQQNSDLNTTNWITVTKAPKFNLTNLQNQVTISLSPSNTFYRLATP